MKKLLLLSLTCLFLVTGCTKIEEVLSADEAQELVIEEYRANMGKLDIVKVEKKGNNYIVHWENTDNLEKGMSRVNKKKEVNLIESSIE